MTDDDRPLDLSALDPTHPRATFDRRLARIQRATEGVVRRRREGGTALGLVARWRVPLLAAATLIMAVSATLARGAAGDPSQTLVDAIAADSTPPADASDEIADALGLSTALGTVLLSDSASAADFLLGGYWP